MGIVLILIFFVLKDCEFYTRSLQSLLKFYELYLLKPSRLVNVRCKAEMKAEFILAYKSNAYHEQVCLQYEPRHDKTNKLACAPSEDSDQPGHPPSLIRVFTVRMKKALVLTYPLSAQRRL